jgi:KDO2-lipid IV(A) lauroyltransferase
VLLTPHLGSFEVCGAGLCRTLRRAASRSPCCTGPARKRWLREVEETARPPGAGHRAGHAGRRAADDARAARGETVGLLPDQVPPEGMGVWAPFFGRRPTR